MRPTEKQRKFCNEYMIDLNATKAAERAGYSSKTARSQGQRLLTKVDIQGYLLKLKIQSQKETEINRETILKELGAILKAKITDYLEFNGEKITFKSFSKLSDEQIKGIESIKETRYGIELKLHGKNWTIERLCKMLGFDEPENINIKLNRLNDEALDAIIEKIINTKSSKYEKY
ncbi:MAG: terminase small subunit [Bacteroidales bacterium]|nr:terminase small subunit [Bacteroidales bacterium]